MLSTYLCIFLRERKISEVTDNHVGVILCVKRGGHLPTY